MLTRSGFSSAEILVASLAAALLSVPLLVLMFQERDTGQRARFEYLALLAAREEMYEARFLVAAGAAPKSIEHPFQDVEGSLVRRLPASISQRVRTRIDYHPSQKRLQTRVSVEPGKGRLSQASVVARWLDSGTSSTEPSRPDAVKLITGLLAPPAAARKP